MICLLFTINLLVLSVVWVFIVVNLSAAEVKDFPFVLRQWFTIRYLLGETTVDIWHEVRFLIPDNYSDVPSSLNVFPFSVRRNYSGTPCCDIYKWHFNHPWSASWCLSWMRRTSGHVQEHVSVFGKYLDLLNSQKTRSVISPLCFEYGNFKLQLRQSRRKFPRRLDDSQTSENPKTLHVVWMWLLTRTKISLESRTRASINMTFKWWHHLTDAATDHGWIPSLTCTISSLFLTQFIESS